MKEGTRSIRDDVVFFHPSSFIPSLRRDDMAGSPDFQAARIKLHELRRQRDRLDEHYGAVERRAAQAATPLERLRILFDGLRQATFARKPLHPEVANLDGLFLQGQLGIAPPDFVEAWLQRLQRELDRGRLRAEFAHAFGGVLAEPPSLAVPAPVETSFLLADTVDEPTTCDPAFLDTVLDTLGPQALEPLRQEIRRFAEGNAGAAVTDEVKALLTLLKKDGTRPAEVRRQAAAALDSPTQIHEFAGVLTILLANLAEWDWPREGLSRRVVLLRDKPRLFLEEDLLTALLLQLLGLRWGMFLKPQRKQLLSNAGSGLWPPVANSGRISIQRNRAFQADKLFLAMMPPRWQELVRTGGYLSNDLEEQFRWVCAEIRFHQAAFPNRPLHVVRSDVRDFYPRIPHAALLRLLERIGMPDLWRDFLGRYLRIPIRAEDGIRRVGRGVPLDHRLGDLLAEWLLLLLDLYVEQEAGVGLIRVVDDVFFLTDDADRARQAWQAIVRFCQGLGLEINAEKSGSLTLNGSAVADLPQGPVLWGALQLEGDGTWRLHEPTLERLQDWARRQVEAGGNTLGMVRAYNEACRFLLSVLGLSVEAGANHLVAVGKRLARMQQDLFGPGNGIAALLHGRLREQFRDSRLQQRGLPEALLYWPITAGGLGLVQPLLLVAAYSLARAQYSVPVAPTWPHAGTADWLESREWATFYAALGVEYAVEEPTATPGLAALVQDFIARGTEVAGRRQVNLRPYWKWILYTYGPPLLDALGTFRFLLTELVPLSLVRAGGGEEAEDPADGEDIPF
jgi:hypothetical protein